jgi:hypothetical protein
VAGAQDWEGANANIIRNPHKETNRKERNREILIFVNILCASTWNYKN